MTTTHTNLLPADRWSAQAVVIGAGSYPRHPIPLAILHDTPLTVCCDGATQAYLAHEGTLPWRIVGDGDSLPQDLRLRCRSIFIQETEQETNDQTKATRLLHAEGITRIAYLGATGRREDHTLGNISLLPVYQRMGLDVRMYTDHGVFLLPSAVPEGGYRLQLTAPVGQPVSLWNFGATNLTAQGLQYPLYPFTELWQGTLNRLTHPHLTVQANGPFLLYLAYRP